MPLPGARRAYIAQWRAVRGLTQRELAAQTGMALSTINQIETGKSKPQPTTLRRLARALGIEIWRLYSYPGDSYSVVPDAAPLIARLGELARAAALDGKDGNGLAAIYVSETVDVADADGWHRAEQLRADAAAGITLLLGFWEELGRILLEHAPMPEARALAESGRAYQLAEWRRLGMDLATGHSPNRGLSPPVSDMELAPHPAK